jgi:membrane protein implicated in regulation of membrane protease activity
MSLSLVRVWLPAAIAVAGLALIAFGGGTAQGAGIVLVGVAVLVVLANLLARLSLSSERDRAREEESRRFFARRGRWPDDGP